MAEKCVQQGRFSRLPVTEQQYGLTLKAFVLYALFQYTFYHVFAIVFAEITVFFANQIAFLGFISGPKVIFHASNIMVSLPGKKTGLLFHVRLTPLTALRINVF